MKPSDPAPEPTFPPSPAQPQSWYRKYGTYLLIGAVAAIVAVSYLVTH